MSIHQTLTRVNVQGRYAAHVELDRLYAHRSRVDRPWHHAIVEVEPGHFWALIRTTDKTVVTESPSPSAWSSFEEPVVGAGVDLLIQYTPKKVGQYSRFYESDDFAIAHISERLDDAISGLKVTPVGEQRITIDKRGRSYTAPSRIVRIEGVVKDAAQMHKLLVVGIGGSRAFGLGLPIDPTSPLYRLLGACYDID